jgi:hypothetical protein
MSAITIRKSNIIAQDNDTITIELPDERAQVHKLDYAKVKAARGILKGKTDNYIAHVERLRKEWE